MRYFTKLPSFHFLMSMLAIMCCISCRGLFRNELSKNDNRLMIRIFGDSLSKEIHLRRVHHQTSNWQESFSYAVYEIEITSETLSRIVKSKAMKELHNELDRDDFIALNIFTHYEYSKISDKARAGLINVYWGQGFGLYIDNSIKPFNAFLYIQSRDLLLTI